MCQCECGCGAPKGHHLFLGANQFGIGGGGIAREVPGTGGLLIERYRPDSHEPFGDHVNLEIHLNTTGRGKPILSNTHIAGLDWGKEK